MPPHSLVCVFSDGKYRMAIAHNNRTSTQHIGCALLDAAREMSRDRLKVALRERVTLLERWDDQAVPAHLAYADPVSFLQAVHDSAPGQCFSRLNELPFVGDSAAVGSTYVLDLDAGIFEVHAGRNRQPLSRGDRFFGYPQEHGDYYPVRLVRSWSLDALPDDEEMRAHDPLLARTQPRPPSSSIRPAPQPVVF